MKLKNIMKINIYDYVKDIFRSQIDLIIFEIGCHIGRDTEKLFNHFSNPNLYCFECDPRNIEQFKQSNIFNKVQLFELAICNHNGTSTFYQSNGHPQNHNRNNTASSSLYKPTGHLKQWDWVIFNNKISVNTCKLDTFCQNHSIDHIDFIWADTQGAEYDLILGAQNILKHTKYLYTEYSNKELYQGQKSLEFIHRALPGKWSLVHDFKSDVLLKNEGFK